MRYGLFVAAVTLLLVFGFRSAQAQPYLDLGVMVHQQSWAEPEIRLSDPLGTVEIGYQHGRYSVYVRHMSSISQYEDGYGLTGVGASVRLTLDDLP